MSVFATNNTGTLVHTFRIVRRQLSHILKTWLPTAHLVSHLSYTSYVHIKSKIQSGWHNIYTITLVDLLSARM